MHPLRIKDLQKRAFPCSECDKSFTSKSCLSRHRVVHKEATNLQNNINLQNLQERDMRISELEAIISQTNRERQLELRNVALEKVVSESQQENERLTTMFYKLRSRKLDFIPINSVSHIDTIDEPLYKLIMHHGEEGPSTFLNHIFFNKKYLDRQSLSVCKDDNGVIHCQRYDGKNGPESVSSSELMNEILLSFCSTMTTCLAKYSVPRNELSHTYQNQEKLRLFINNLETIPIYRSMISSKLLEECLKLRPMTIQC
jgi:hypothetical protein